MSLAIYVCHVMSPTSQYQTELIWSTSQNAKDEGLGQITTNTEWGSNNAVKRQKLSGKSQRDEGYNLPDMLSKFLNSFFHLQISGEHSSE